MCVAGAYNSRHGNQAGRAKPDETALIALEELVRDYLVPRHGLKSHQVLTAADCGHPANPGDYLEWRVRCWRGEKLSEPWTGPLVQTVVPEGDDARDLSTPDKWTGALRALGYDVGESSHWSDRAQRALQRVQADLGLRPDGVWGPVTEAAVRHALALVASGSWWTARP